MHHYLIIGLLQVACLSVRSEVIKHPLKTAVGKLDDTKRLNDTCTNIIDFLGLFHRNIRAPGHFRSIHEVYVKEP